MICSAIEKSLPTLVLGEVGLYPDLPVDIADEFKSEFMVVIATYKGSAKKFFQSIAKQIDVPTSYEVCNAKGEPTGEKDFTVDQLKEEIANNCSSETLFILPSCKRLTTGIKYWLEDLLEEGIRLVCFATVPPRGDLYLEMTTIELDLPADKAIRQVMVDEAERLGLELSRSELAQLMTSAGKNPMIARQTVRNKALGLKGKKGLVNHTQYVDVMPIVITTLLSFGIFRFIGMGTGNKSLYILAGCSLIAGMMLKQLGQIRAVRKKLGQ